MSSSQTDGITTTNTFNADELASVATPMGSFAYGYDDGGNVTSTALNGTQVQGTVWDTNGSLPMAAEDTSAGGATAADYTYGPGGILASMSTPGGTYNAVSDWLDSVASSAPAERRSAAPPTAPTAHPARPSAWMTGRWQ